jgi:hypothetical protein
MSVSNERGRMIVDVPNDVQMAIRLAAVKTGATTGDIVTQAVKQAFRDDLREAKRVLAKQAKEHRAVS